MNEKPGEVHFKEGMQYNWSQDPASAHLARAAFSQAASEGHLKATRALAHLIYEGCGGEKDQEEALMLLWSCFLRGDHDCLAELEDMLESYAEQVPPPPLATAALQVAESIRQLSGPLGSAHRFMLRLSHDQQRRNMGSK